MGVPNMLNTIMKTAHDLLLNTVFYLMGICVITGAIGRLFVEFGVVSLLEKLLRPLMRPLFNLPGVASLGLVPSFMNAGWVDGNAIAVFTAIGMCWSGYLSTHTAMLDSLGYRELTSKAIVSHTIGGIAAGMVAHWTYVLVMLL